MFIQESLSPLLLRACLWTSYISGYVVSGPMRFWRDVLTSNFLTPSTLQESRAHVFLFLCLKTFYIYSKEIPRTATENSKLSDNSFMFYSCQHCSCRNRNALMKVTIYSSLSIFSWPLHVNVIYRRKRCCAVCTMH